MEHLDVEGLKEGPTEGCGPKSWSRRDGAHIHPTERKSQLWLCLEKGTRYEI